MSGKGNSDPYRSLSLKGELFFMLVVIYSISTFIWPNPFLIINIISGKMAPGFGIGALEDLDAEDEDIYDTGSDFTGS